ncbi:MAG: glycosyltransferase, partial [Muribaculaceae bacterium]|nr:glycosyltransferase [Muribaculaceae bacterium]
MSLHPNTLKIKKETGKATTVSVLMSVYSEPLDWVKQSIESILTQTFTDFEFIIINDNPQNPKLAFFLNQQSKKEPRIKLHTNPTNIGLTKSLNIGLKLCRGKYIVRMDADDVSLPERLVQQVKFMERNPNIIASSALAYEWDGDNVVGKVYRPTTPQSIKEYIFTSSPFIHPLLIIRRDILEKYSIKYDESFRVSQDYKLAADLIEIGTIANIDDYLLKYRISRTQISNRKGLEQVENDKLRRRKI